MKMQEYRRRDPVGLCRGLGRERHGGRLRDMRLGFTGWCAYTCSAWLREPGRPKAGRRATSSSCSLPRRCSS